MKINGINRPQIEAGPPAKRVASRDVSDQATKVLVSNEAKQLAEARQPAVSDAEKVQRLADAIARGQFSIDAERLIDRLMAEEL